MTIAESIVSAAGPETGSLDTLLIAAMRGTLKFIFVGGKGGVGKTTTSSAIASLLATTCGKRVLLVSTDPAHSLGDAWRKTFTNKPTSVIEKGWNVDGNSCGEGGGVSQGYLEVMEIDPSDSMEEELARWAEYAKTIAGNEDSKEGAEESGGLTSKIAQFQSWLSGIPGIDEATALSAAIAHIDSGKYDIIVFDTAPTGHTLKLLALPDVLSEGIKKLQSWQASAWTYWEAFKGFASSGSTEAARKRSEVRKDVEERLIKYREDIGRVATMLKDNDTTAFVVVCIAEHLSVMETRRLIGELGKNGVASNHVVVNQLVSVGSSERSGSILSKMEMDSLEASREIGLLVPDLMQKVIHACRLTAARGAIQSKYLEELRRSPEARNMASAGGVVEVPLLAEEVTGRDAIIRFGALLSSISSGECPDVGMADSMDVDAKNEEFDGAQYIPSAGDAVTITGLMKASEYNGQRGRVAGEVDPKTGRCPVIVGVNDKSKKLALLSKNMRLVQKASQREESENRESPGGDGMPSDDTMNKAKSLLMDPEIQQMIAANPKVADAVKDVMANPANFMKYMGDPELSGFLSKAMAKFMA